MSHTIAAVSTGNVISAIGIIRLSWISTMVCPSPTVRMIPKS